MMPFTKKRSTLDETKGLSVAEKFAKIQSDQEKGIEPMMPGQQEDTGIRVTISHPFPEKDRVAWLSIGFTREEVFSNDPLVDKLKKASIKLAGELQADFDEAMVLAEPIVAPNKASSPPNTTIAPAVQASGDDEECPKCRSKMKWLTKPRKDGKTDKQGNAITWSAWSCPNTHPSIDVSERCTQELIFLDKR